VGLGDGALRTLAAVVLAVFGVVLLVPWLGARVEAPLSRLARFGPRSRGDGFVSGLAVGGALGFAYAPCAGPILAAVIYGRSDSTINRHGVRMGTSEIYRAVLEVDEVVDALVVDVPRPGTEGWMPLFVVLAEDTTLDDEIKGEIKRRIREDCSPRHVPNEIYEVAEIPRTLSGKVLEIPVKKILMGTRPENAASRDSLANPEALDYFVELARSLPVG